jgi:hypothetical protein
VLGSCDGRTVGLFCEAVITEPWEGVGKAMMVGTHMAQEGAFGGVRCSH